jgi:glycosyltransferase involved in cell wall biosynthesis
MHRPPVRCNRRFDGARFVDSAATAPDCHFCRRAAPSWRERHGWLRRRGGAVTHSSHAQRRGAELLARAAEIDELDVTIFMPCRNEQGNVTRSLNEVAEAFKPYAYRYEIIVVDDASTDGSVAEIREFMAQNPHVRILLKENPRPLGVSYNLSDAAILGRGRYFQFISSAFQNRRQTIRSTLDELGNADIIVTRLDPDYRPVVRRRLSRLYTWLVNLVSGYNVSHYHGTPLFRRIDVIRWHSYRTVGFYSDMITRMLDEGVSYMEVPTTVHDREMGKSSALRPRNVISLLIGFSDMLLRRFSKDRIPPRRLLPCNRGLRGKEAKDPV